MLAYLPIIEQVIKMGLIKRHHLSAIKFNMGGLVLMVCGLCTALATIIFLILALQDWLRLMIDSPYANSAAWGICGILMMICAAIFLSLAGKFKKTQGGLVSVTFGREEGEPLVKTVTNELHHQIKEYPLISVLIAGLAGVVAGEKIGDKIN